MCPAGTWHHDAQSQIILRCVCTRNASFSLKYPSGPAHRLHVTSRITGAPAPHKINPVSNRVDRYNMHPGTHTLSVNASDSNFEEEKSVLCMHKIMLKIPHTRQLHLLQEYFFIPSALPYHPSRSYTSFPLPANTVYYYRQI